MLFLLLSKKLWNRGNLVWFIRCMENRELALLWWPISWKSTNGGSINVLSLSTAKRKGWKSGITILCKCRNWKKGSSRALNWAMFGMTPKIRNRRCWSTLILTRKNLKPWLRVPRRLTRRKWLGTRNLWIDLIILIWVQLWTNSANSSKLPKRNSKINLLLPRLPLNRFSKVFQASSTNSSL